MQRVQDEWRRGEQAEFCGLERQLVDEAHARDAQHRDKREREGEMGAEKRQGRPFIDTTGREVESTLEGFQRVRLI